MKKSNRVFIALIATLYIVPALTFGVAQFTSEKCLTGFTQKFQIIQIDNPELKAENIKVDTRTASKFPRGQILEANVRVASPFLFFRYFYFHNDNGYKARTQALNWSPLSS